MPLDNTLTACLLLLHWVRVHGERNNNSDTSVTPPRKAQLAVCAKYSFTITKMNIVEAWQDFFPSFVEVAYLKITYAND